VPRRASNRAASHRSGDLVSGVANVKHRRRRKVPDQGGVRPMQGRGRAEIGAKGSRRKRLSLATVAHRCRRAMRSAAGLSTQPNCSHDHTEMPDRKGSRFGHGRTRHARPTPSRPRDRPRRPGRARHGLGGRLAFDRLEVIGTADFRSLTEVCDDGRTVTSRVRITGGHEEQAEDGVTTLDRDYPRVQIQSGCKGIIQVTTNDTDFTWSPSLRLRESSARPPRPPARRSRSTSPGRALARSRSTRTTRRFRAGPPRSSAGGATRWRPGRSCSMARHSSTVRRRTR
jgi:hypothetical protein